MADSGNSSVLAKKSYGAAAFLPLVTFLALYLGFGLFFYFRGESSPFSFVPREAALIFGIAVALLMGRDKFEAKTQSFMRHAASPTLIQQCLIFLLAGIFSSVSKAMGGVTAVVNAGMAILPERFIVPGLFLISCLISISMGTSFGTVSAVGPLRWALPSWAATT
jgi:Na+/H+ antiporter NhaC